MSMDRLEKEAAGAASRNESQNVTAQLTCWRSYSVHYSRKLEAPFSGSKSHIISA